MTRPPSLTGAERRILHVLATHDPLKMTEIAMAAYPEDFAGTELEAEDAVKRATYRLVALRRRWLARNRRMEGHTRWLLTDAGRAEDARLPKPPAREGSAADGA